MATALTEMKTELDAARKDRDEAQAYANSLLPLVTRVHRERDEMLRNLTAVQAECTRLLNICREKNVSTSRIGGEWIYGGSSAASAYSVKV